MPSLMAQALLSAILAASDDGPLTMSSLPPEGLRILLADDEPNIRKTMIICLEQGAHAVVAVSNARDAATTNARQIFDLAFVDIRLGNDSGLDLIPELLAANPALKIVVITAYASIDSAVKAIKCGAYDYLPKPFTPAQIEIVVRKASDVLALENKLHDTEAELGQNSPDIELASLSPVMQRTLALAKQVAGSAATVALSGETGTGKGVLARLVHRWSARARKPFSVVSCPSLSSELLESELFGHVRGAFTGAQRDNPGRVALTEGGTLFLDEIGELPLPLQSKLLRFIQEREYERIGDPVTRQADVRVLTATNRDLKQAVANGTFREDLYYRLNVIQIELPPLRQRVEDIERLAGRLCAFFARQNHRRSLSLSDDALATLKAHSWPGNVRELRNTIERAAILCPGESIGAEYLPLPRQSPLREPPPELGALTSLEHIEEEHIRRVIAATHSLEAAASVLGIDQATLWRKRKKMGI